MFSSGQEIVKNYVNIGTLNQLIEPDNILPSAVSNFSAIGADNEIKLFWQNPADSDFCDVEAVEKVKFIIWLKK